MPVPGALASSPRSRQVWASTIKHAWFMEVISGVGCPVAGVIMSTRGNCPLAPAVNEPLKVALDDGVPAGGAALALNESVSAVPDRVETPSEMTCPAKFCVPRAVLTTEFAAYLPPKEEAGMGAVNVC